MSFIAGIQQIGIGVKDAREAMLLYKDLFGMDTLIFDDTSDATLMTKYTGGNIHKRRAILSMNLQGGGGFEIWQFLSREPSAAAQTPKYGDLGIYAAKIKSEDVGKSHKRLQQNAQLQTTPLQKDAAGELHFFTTDPYGNVFNVVSGNHWFQKGKSCTGGVAGAIIGVANMDTSLLFYKNILGINEVVYDVSDDACRKVLLRKSAAGKGAFNNLLGTIDIELVQSLTPTNKIYNNRFWGDCGFIHLCFDVLDMCALKQHAQQHNFNFTVDSNDTFAMEDAGGRFCYVEDPDGTLIELVETHKVPILKKFGWYLNLKKRDIEKPLPNWMIKLLALSKVK